MDGVNSGKSLVGDPPLAVLHTLASLKASSGGTSRSVPALCEALGSLKLNVSLVSQHAKWPPSPDLTPNANAHKVRTYLAPAVNVPTLRLSYSPGLERHLTEICTQQHIDIMHGHGMWLHTNHITSRVARRLNIPLVISPHGMLEEWALAYRSWKKALAWKLYQATDLHAARAFCATSTQEAMQLRKLGLRQPIAVIPNGVNIPPPSLMGRPKTGPHKALFLSRVHPKKGLLDLVHAWRALRPAGWRLVIAGPDEDGYTTVVKAAVAEAGLNHFVDFVGEVNGDAKDRLWQEADLFILPSYSENFGIVVAEALAWEVPVITTRGAPWSVLVESRAGWWIDPGLDGLTATLEEAVKLSDAERLEMGRRGRQLAQIKFDWRSVAQDMADFYGWLLGRADKPDCIFNDD